MCIHSKTTFWHQKPKHAKQLATKLFFSALEHSVAECYVGTVTACLAGIIQRLNFSVDISPIPSSACTLTSTISSVKTVLFCFTYSCISSCMN